jgi:hypothetical protein
VTLANGGDAIDIDAPNSDPTWGAGSIGIADPYISFSGGALHFQFLDILTLDGGEAATHETCSTRTGYAEGGHIDPGTLEGLDTCVRTSAGRFAAVRLNGYSDNAVTLNITTWQLA